MIVRRDIVRDKALKKELRQALQQNPDRIDSIAPQNVLMLSRGEVSRRQKRRRISFAGFLMKQVKFLGWKIWGVQLSFLLLIAAMFSPAFRDYAFYNLRIMTRVLICLSVLVSVSALPLFYRSVRCQMHEVEAAARFSSVKLLMAKLIVIGMGDLCLLSGIFAAAVIQTSLQAGTAALYLFVPFLLMSGGCLYMLGHFRARQFYIGGLFLGGVLILLCLAAPSRYYSLLFQQSFTAGWTAVCGILLLFCIWQIRHILYCSSYSEMLIA